MNKNILIVGAGQLGRRYIEGLYKITMPLNIYVLEKSKSVQNLVDELQSKLTKENKAHTVYLINNLLLNINEIDLVIISTTANVRYSIISKINIVFNVKNWIIEKVLAQNNNELLKLSNLIKFQKNCWVNTPRRIMPWYKKIKSKIGNVEKLNVTVTGGNWGLACNSIHFIDLLEWITGENVISINTRNLDKIWIKSKRIGFYEITGKLIVNFSKGSVLNLKCSKNNDNPIVIKLKDKNYTWLINESKGIAIRSDNYIINGDLVYQSKLTPKLVNNILLNKKIELTNLFESINQHSQFLSQLLLHWNKYMPQKKYKLPIT